METKYPPDKAGTALEVAPEESIYTLGARKAWCSVAGSVLLQLATIGPIAAFGVFQDFYTVTWLSQYSKSEISWIGSTGLFLELTFGVIGGKLYDMGYCYSVLLSGSVLWTFSFFMLSLVQEQRYYQIFLAQGLGMGLGVSLIFVPTITLVSHHFRVKKGLAMGILSSSGPLGTLIFTILLNQLIHYGPGFQWAVRAAAFLSLGCLVLGNILISVPSRRAQSLIEPPQLQNKTILKNIPYTLTIISGFVAQLGTFFPLFYIQLFAVEHSISNPLAFYSLAIMNGAGIVGRSLPGYAADKWGSLEVWSICEALSGALCFAMLGSDSVVGLVLFCILYGFFFGGVISVYMPVVATLTPREANMGASLGIASIPIGIAALIGNPIIGAIMGTPSAWWKGVTFASVCMIASAGITILARSAYVQKH
ncbi:major facilitator superfamily domain-containing protein [Armillaria luteobubalina]|uniref:Major facilitator superfamily domain-containing protein n=1 Tax=Armillaria luteobubalina TaxID=153913 RepID=A0AA39QCY3_9AGAR|nr:major facilitator superfamily domain-containing protein [Armillaria luteobubalina]